MNKRIYNIIKNDINDYEEIIQKQVQCNGAIFEIYNDFFHEIAQEKEAYKLSGVKIKHVLKENIISDNFNIISDSLHPVGVSFILDFDNMDYCINFKSWRDNQDMFYLITIVSWDEVYYSSNFIYKYFLYNALEFSKLKGSYFTMPRDTFSWDIKTMETRTFNDIFLPTELTEDLRLYVDIFNKSEVLLRYLKVGNPGVGKTESTLVLSSELKKLGVTVIKTPICQLLKQKVELANVLEPAVIILDDIDLSLGDRNKGSYGRLLGDFLDVLDGTDKMSRKVGLIATTNAAHLLDIAAQRPGRFDKTLLFDNITKSNIKNIILKSLKVNFKLKTGPDVLLYSDKKIVNAFYDAGVTGSHIYNAIKMLKLRHDTIGTEDLNVDKIVENINHEIKTIAKIRKLSFLKDTLDRGTGTVGFGNKYEDEDDEVVEKAIVG